MLKVLSLAQPLQQQLTVSKKEVPYDVAIEIARVRDKTDQEELVKDAARGATVRTIRKRTKELKPKKAKKPTDSTRKIRVTKGWRQRPDAR